MTDIERLKSSDSKAVQALLLADQHGWSAWVEAALGLALAGLFAGKLPHRLEEQLQKLFLEFVLEDYPAETAEFLREVFAQKDADGLRAIREAGGIAKAKAC